ncbi:mitochondrial fission ELM1 family protein [Microvirga lotononidis]|uniref:Putative nucleoside-diphosphate-sugar epimerase n=1 Tax=Microvirga lotononidis TaxID=864069 RepID=I4YPN0_9HYPH|nr:mitochondrial fission ELM1 family protein [Microvirga lotononidis]EIM25922.1 putative nucleoside-diphosphate-sugar epimerase [Microvirga lotononidis]WQO25837.1 mitochondrial fission ELM1 family protein [Microvirga lotononidis]
MLRKDSGLITWVLTDGKAGDELQALSVTEALGLLPEIRRVKPRPPFSWLMPWGPIDPRERPGVPGSPLAPPYPDLLVASGRRAVAYLRFVRKASGGRAYTVFLKDPRTGPETADLIWSPEYDRLRGPNVLNTLTPPHRVAAGKLEAARVGPDPRLASLARPRVAVLAGGNSRHHRFTDDDIASFIRHLTALAETGAGLMVTASRRTPPPLREALAGLTARHGGFFWDGAGANPYVDLLAQADFIVATADSFNMIGEAAVTGRPILVFEPSGGHPKLDIYMQALKAHGVVHPFEGRLEGQPYEPLNSTPKVAKAIAEGFRRHRRALGLPDIALSLETP